MIIDFSIENFMIFGPEVTFSFVPSKMISRFGTNVFDDPATPFLKAVGVYGPNNTGKSCSTKALRCLKKVVEGFSLEDYCQRNKMEPNWFSHSSLTHFKVAFSSNGTIYRYSFSFDFADYSFASECIEKQNKNGEYSLLLSYDLADKKYGGNSREVVSSLKVISHRLPALFSLKVDGLPPLAKAQKDFWDFGHSLVFFGGSGTYSIDRTISYLKNGGDDARTILNFVKGADLSLDDFSYNKKSEWNDINENGVSSDLASLVSDYGGHRVPSVFYDSRGTQKIEALAGYVVSVLKNGGTLVVDEMDASLFFKVSRAVVSSFNNVANHQSQLFFTTHDISLMDTRYLLRKDQIYFVSRDPQTRSASVVPLSSFTARKDGLRGNEDAAERYRKGLLEELPDPDFLSVLLDLPLAEEAKEKTNPSNAIGKSEEGDNE